MCQSRGGENTPLRNHCFCLENAVLFSSETAVLLYDTSSQQSQWKNDKISCSSPKIHPSRKTVDCVSA